MRLCKLYSNKLVLILRNANKCQFHIRLSLSHAALSLKEKRTKSLKEADEEFITFQYLAHDIDRNSSDFNCRGSSLTV